jgi:rod shape-determining protein MreD
MSGLRPVGLLLGLAILQVFLPQVWSPLGAVDWLLIYIVHESLRGSFQRSILTGAGGGLLQDGLSGGIVGLHAFAKTAVAAVIASFGSFLVVRGPLLQALVTAAATFVEGLIVAFWQAMLGRPVSMGPLDILLRAVATGIATALLLAAARRWQQRALRRGHSGTKAARP